jgi:hypothetical protein
VFARYGDVPSLLEDAESRGVEEPEVVNLPSFSQSV